MFNPFPRLPKNIRQIGDKDDVVKLYVEDYVNTYLKRLFPAGGRDLRVGLLLGTSEVREGVPYLFVDGALEMEETAVSGEKVVFTEAAWKKAYQSIEESFPKRTVQGWFICGAPGCMLSPLNYWRQHNQYFGGKNQLMYLNSGIDGEEALYVASEDGFYRLKGYSIYYERNQMMQDYMILRKDAHRVESGTGDRVIRDFRSRMEGRKQEAVSRHGTIRTLGTLCSVLSVAVLAGGVVMFNNYQRMKEMESVLVSVLPEGMREVRGNGSEEDGLIVEEVHGSVTPETMESTLEDSPEKPAENGAENRTGATAENGAENRTGATAENGAENKPEYTEESTGENAVNSTAQKAASETEPRILPEPEAQNEATSENLAGKTVAGGNATAVRDYLVTNKKPGGTYTIGEGETLYGICFKLYDSLKYLNDIRALNHLDDADRIMAGQELILPDLSETGDN